MARRITWHACVSVERNQEGALVVSGVDRSGYPLRRIYYYYTRREALAMFRRELADS